MRMRLQTTALAALVPGLLACLAAPAAVLAGDGSGERAPELVELRIGALAGTVRGQVVLPGERRSGGPESRTPCLVAVDWTANDQGRLCYAVLPEGQEARHWFQVVAVERHTERDAWIVSYEVSLPQGASGTYSCALQRVDPGATPSSPQPGTPMDATCAAVVVVHVGPTAKRVRIVSFDVVRDEARVVVQNTGNAHLALSGTLELRTPDGRVVRHLFRPAWLTPGIDRRYRLRVPLAAHSARGTVATVLLDCGSVALVGARRLLEPAAAGTRTVDGRNDVPPLGSELGQCK